MLLPDDLQLDNPLWDYALSIYPKLETRLLELQSEGVRVNHLLTGLWMGAQGRLMNTEYQLSDRWFRDNTAPVRASRIALKLQLGRVPQLNSCYQQVKSAELALEQVELALLYWEQHQTTELDSQAMRKNLLTVLEPSHPQNAGAIVDQLIAFFHSLS